MHPLPKNKFFRLRGSYLWPVLRSLVPLSLVPLVRSFVPGSSGPHPIPSHPVPSHPIPAYLDEALTMP